jgi:hypothetical protein
MQRVPLRPGGHGGQVPGVGRRRGAGEARGGRGGALQVESS